MELMEIIKSSISLLMILAFILIFLSYVVFKIKDRSRIKPYLRVNMQENAAGNIASVPPAVEQIKKEQIFKEAKLKQEQFQHEHILRNEQLLRNDQLKLEQLRHAQVQIEEQFARSSQYINQSNFQQTPVHNIDLLRTEKVKHELNYRQEKIRLEQIRQEQIKLEQIKNEQLRREHLLRQESQLKHDIRNSGNKFRVVNERTPIFQNAVPVMQFANNSRSANIYDLYSQNEQERMHKLKLANSYK